MTEATRVALVTGGTRGIGSAVARRLAKDGFSVVISGHSKDSVARAVEEFARDGISVAGRAADARSEKDQTALVRFVDAEKGRLDVLVNNAGIGGFAPVDEISADDFRAIVETNLCGPFYAIRAAAPVMRRNGGGFIVNIASLASVNAFAGGSAYNASKFGLLGLSESAMLDLRHGGIRVAAVLPGSVATEFGGSHGGRESSWMLSADDVAQAVADLVRFPDRAIPSRIDLRPSKPPGK
jgi:3-oxoacyl-[acyl-carrier protein] reductase